jgi:hypothetical protein
MRGGKRVARPDDWLMGTPPTAQEGAVRIIRRAQVHDPHLPWIPYVSTTTRRIPSGAVRRCGDVSTAVASGLRFLQ